MSLLAPLLTTTRNPLWVHPLLWRLDHLDHLHIVITTVTTTTNHLQQPSTLGNGFISSRDLRYILQDVGLLEIYLGPFITRTVNSFQKALRPQTFRFYSQGNRPPLFTFHLHTLQTHPDLTIRTHRGLPFLLYTSTGSLRALRKSFPTTTAGARLEWRLKYNVGKLDYTSAVIDPYNIAAIIAVAQEQRAWYGRSKREAPDVFKVYLLTPCAGRPAVRVYCAEVPERYLRALMDPGLEQMPGNVAVTRQVVELPVPPVSGQSVVTSGPFLDMLKGILEEAVGH